MNKKSTQFQESSIRDVHRILRICLPSPCAGQILTKFLILLRTSEPRTPLPFKFLLNIYLIEGENFFKTIVEFTCLIEIMKIGFKSF